MADQPIEDNAADAIDDAERESAYGLLQRGQALIKSRHHAQAAIVLARAARAEPRKGSILEPLGRAYHHSGQFELARQTFEELLEVDPSHHWAHFALSATLRKLGRAREARTEHGDLVGMRDRSLARVLDERRALVEVVHAER